MAKAWTAKVMGLTGCLLTVLIGTTYADGTKDANVSPAAAAEADKVWTSRCALCHGAGGKGDGPSAAVMDPKPRALTDPTWQHAVDDARIETVILKGGPSVQLSPFMPANPELAAKPEVVHALRVKVRSLEGK